MAYNDISQGNPYKYGQAEYNPNGDAYNGQIGSTTPNSTINALAGQQPKASNPFDGMITHATALKAYLSGGMTAAPMRYGDEPAGPENRTPTPTPTPKPAPTPVGPATTPYNPIAGHPLHPSTGNPNLSPNPAPYGPGNPDPNAPPAPPPTPAPTPTPTTPTPQLPPPTLPTTPEALNPHNTQDLINFIHTQYRPAFLQQQTDLRRNLDQQAATSGMINSGGYGDVLGREMSRLIGQQGQQEGDLVNTATNNDFNRQLQKYGIDADALIRQYVAQSTNNNEMTTNDVNRENNIMRYILGIYGLSPGIINSLFPYTPGGIIQPSQPPLNPPLVRP